MVHRQIFAGHIRGAPLRAGFLIICRRCPYSHHPRYFCHSHRHLHTPKQLLVTDNEPGIGWPTTTTGRMAAEASRIHVSSVMIWTRSPYPDICFQSIHLHTVTGDEWKTKTHVVPKRNSREHLTDIVSHLPPLPLDSCEWLVQGALEVIGGHFIDTSGVADIWVGIMGNRKVAIESYRCRSSSDYLTNYMVSNA